MPVAAIADIHGNIQALDAVLADPRCAAAERIVVLGDVIAGTFPGETFDRLAGLCWPPGVAEQSPATRPDPLGDRVRILSGNAERIVLEQDGEESRWARDLLGPERLAAVAAWPASFSIEVEQLGAVLCCHATPTSDEEPLTRITPEADLLAALEGTDEPVVIGGHTHVQYDRVAGPRRYVNVGSVGRPSEGRPGAYWALLGPDVELIRTEYDVEAAAAAVRASGQPTADAVVEKLLNPPTAEEWTALWEGMRGAD
jgi:predicted phosphodiesterase